MGDKKKVSVIVPAYNVEKYIGPAIQSLIDQTYGNIEIIVVDDGSSDGTSSIIDSLSKKDERIIPIHKENGGVSEARNCGIDQAGGEYIFFLDGDDTAEPYAIENLVNAVEKSGADLIGCQYSRWDETGKKLEDYNFKDFNLKFNSGDEKLGFITDELLSYNMGFEIWDKLFKRDIIKAGKVHFDKRCRMGEDLAFNIKYILNCRSIYCIPDRCVRYRIRQGSAMADTAALPKKLEDDLLVLSDVWNYMHDTDNTGLIKKYGSLFVKGMDHVFSGHSVKEAQNAFKELKDMDFALKRYKEADLSSSAFKKMYGNDSPTKRLMFHRAVRRSAGAAHISDGILLFAYKIFRKLKGLSKFEELRLP